VWSPTITEASTGLHITVEDIPKIEYSSRFRPRLRGTPSTSPVANEVNERGRRGPNAKGVQVLRRRHEYIAIRFYLWAKADQW